MCAGLTSSTLVLAGNSASAHARALRVSAHPGKEGWSFVYRGPHGWTRERSLYLPKDRRVILRVVRREDHAAAVSRDVAEAGDLGRVIRMDPLHRGELTVPCGQRQIPADVLGPKQFQAQLRSVGAAHLVQENRAA